MSDLPGDLELAARSQVGEPLRSEALAGLSGTRVVRLSGPDGHLVAKYADERERAVYTHLAPVLARAGVRIPRLVADVAGWLLLEHLPHAWPQERWGPDPDVLEVLRRLHALPTDALRVLPDPFRPVWDDAVDTAGLAALDLPRGAEEVLATLRAGSDGLFEPVGVVSADPNPLNWRLDDRGRPVLLDWERIGLGHPALDVAIVLPGLPVPEQAAAAASAYGAGVDARQVLTAKAWTVVELAGELGPDAEVVGQLRERVPAWLRQLASEV